MSRINTNVPSLLARRIVGQQNQSLTKSLERLSTGLRINRGADDPAGLIASQNLRAEKTAINAAISNSERADQVINVAEGGLAEVSNLLTELEGLVDKSANDAGLSSEERDANQLQIDSILQTIDRIANSTNFQDIKLLNGNFDYTTSGVDTDNFSEINVNAARIPKDANIDVAVQMVNSAQTGEVMMAAASGGNLDFGGGGTITIEIAGNKGSQQFSFTSGAAGSDVVQSINNFTDSLGVSATLSTLTGDGSGVGEQSSGLVFNSTEYGSNQFVSVKIINGDSLVDVGKDVVADLDGTAEVAGDSFKDVGRDALATINGTEATTDGLTARVASTSLDLEIKFDSANFNTDGDTDNFSITGGGATFQLSPKLDLAGKASLGLPAVTTGQLGSITNGFLSNLKAGGSSNVVTGDVDNAQSIVRDAIRQVSTLRGRLGAFQKNTVGATIRSLGVSLENTAAAESQIRDTDFAEQTASLTRSQILVQASTNVLSIANSQPQNVLALLG